MRWVPIGDVDAYGLDDVLLSCWNCGVAGRAYLFIGASLVGAAEVAPEEAAVIVERTELQALPTDTAGGVVSGDGLADRWVSSARRSCSWGGFDVQHPQPRMLRISGHRPAISLDVQHPRPPMSRVCGRRRAISSDAQHPGLPFVHPAS